jgi:hypothetical protein
MPRTAESILRIENDGADISTTNYWQTTLVRAGKFYLSLNAGAFRLLVPPQHQHCVQDMRTASMVVVSRGPLTLQGQKLPDAVELLFDDGTEEPFSLHLSPGQIDHMPLDTDSARAWVCTVWTHRVGQIASKALELPCHYRRVRQLPDLRPWMP